MKPYYELVASNDIGTQTIGTFNTKKEAIEAKRIVEQWICNDQLDIFTTQPFELFIEKTTY